MRYFCVVLVLIAVVEGGATTRRSRQIWQFPDESVRSYNIFAAWSIDILFPTRKTTTTSTTGRPQEGGGWQTSTRPTGVIFQLQNCLCPAPLQFNPVCGSDGNTYANRQKLTCAQKCGYDVEEVRMGTCQSFMN